MNQLPAKSNESQNDWGKWFALFGYSCILQVNSNKSFTNQLCFSSYVPIWSQAAAYYNIDAVDLLWTTNMFYIGYLVLAPIALYFDRFFTGALCFCAFANCIGIWVIYLAQDQFIIALSGYALVSIGQLGFLSCVVAVSERWFSTYQRNLACGLASSSMYMALEFGYFFPAYLFDGMADQDQINQQISQMNLIFAILGTLALMVFLVSLNYVKYEYQLRESQPVFEQLIFILTNEEHILDLLALSISMHIFLIDIGIGWAYMGLIQYQFAVYSYTVMQGNYIILIFQSSGLLTAIYVCYRIDQESRQGLVPNYQLYLRNLSACGFMAYAIQTFWFGQLHYGIIMFLNIFIGMALNSVYSIQTQAFCEKLFPCSSIILGVILNSSATIIGISLQYILILPELQYYSLWISLVLLTPFSLYFLLFYKTKFRRYEQSNQ